MSCKPAAVGRPFSLLYGSWNTHLLLTFPTWRSADHEVASSSPKWFNYPHLRSLPGPRAVPGPTHPYSFKMFKPLFIKFAPVVLMLLLTLAVKCYSRILNWHPLLHVRKTAMKPESWADTLSAACQWGRASFEQQTPSSQLAEVGCSPQPYSDSPIAFPWAAAFAFAFGMSGSCTITLLRTITLLKAVGPTGDPSAGGGNWPGPPRALCFYFFFVCK